MDVILARLERRFGRFAFENLTLVIVFGMAAAFVLGTIRPEFYEALILDFAAVKRGQVWRLVTYLFLPVTSSPLRFMLWAYFTWFVGTTLEREWGAFKFNMFCIVGMLATTLAALLTGGQAGNMYLLMSLSLAFATMFPDYELLIMLIVPVKAKWLGWLTAGSFVLLASDAGMAERAAIAAALVNYALFCGGTLVAAMRGREVAVRQTSRREAYRAAAADSPEVVAMGTRLCAICGAREEDGADIRVCSCEKCGGVQRNLCLEHARAH